MTIPIYQARSVHECWTIAFNLAEDYQRMINDERFRSSHAVLRVQRDIASDIAHRIKYGESIETK
jgi:hypothetical protein